MSTLVPNRENVEKIHRMVKGLSIPIRLDQYLAKEFPEYSRSFLQKLIKEKQVLLEDCPAKRSAKIENGQNISILLPKLEQLHLKAEKMDIPVFYEDEHLAVVFKRAGIITHPAGNIQQGTLVNGLLAQFESLADAGDDYRPGIVHRLDRDTSGALIIAKTSRAFEILTEKFRHREVKKQYLALVHGEVAFEEGSIELPLGMDPRNREKMKIVHGGKSSITEYKVLKRYPKFTLVQIFLITGRTHQIRVHFKSQKHPLVGDDLYGGSPYLDQKTLYKLANVKSEKNEKLIQRQALHAWRLSFEHPITKEKMLFHAPLPEDLQNTLHFLQKLWPCPLLEEMNIL